MNIGKLLFPIAIVSVPVALFISNAFSSAGVSSSEIAKASELCELRGAEFEVMHTWFTNEYRCTDSYTWHVLPKPKESK